MPNKTILCPDKIHSVELIAPKTYRIDEAGIANCYLLIGDKKALLIDSGNGAGNLLETVQALTDLPVELVLTHRHCDHAGGRNNFKEYGFHKNDNHLVYRIESSKLASKSLCKGTGRDFVYTKKPFKAKKRLFKDTDIFELGGRIVRLMNVPGHTKGSVVFLDESTHLMFTGDDVNYWLWLQLPGCTSVKEWLPGAKKILSMMDEYKAYCGHNDGYISKEMVEELIKRGEEILAGKKGTPIGHGVLSYPDNNFQDHSVIWYKKVQ
ncbi:MAG: MBL fold metallo-hydrolase [Bacilli bacterium]|jgi:glyoxylase-like metal-dependent hydrolase (beta-lactamase superfamily II)|nr:MBL fold metallo-hydrolase [Bacilli bacterium]MCH4210410.1 MBL fold metallo-hydrolase [Bacilli bacterium]MCH4229031.1 MBL fold metallo-hydrolase [Bacilli bacterium]MCH4278245.1 MBL fold metallo-hydrolase [Bacilli bacterium]MCI2055042.1 MBL fold metallo-hydrolase [Bacilli bacterium]